LLWNDGYDNVYLIGSSLYDELQFSREFIEERAVAIEEMHNAVAEILYPNTDSSTGK
jgi:hypothetical protein